MIRRCQVFVVAKVGRRYRGLCSVHSDWHGITGAIGGCLEMLNIFEATENRIPIQQELLKAQSKSETFWSTGSIVNAGTSSDIPFPYISMCLLIRVFLNCWAQSHRGVSLWMPVKSEFEKSHEDETHTIIDISDLTCVRYGFVNHHDHHEIEAFRFHCEPRIASIPLMKPISAETFLSPYLQRTKQSGLEEYYTWLEGFVGRRIVDLNSPRQIWPSEKWHDELDNTDIKTDSGGSPLGYPCQTPTLRSSSMHVVLETLMHSEPDMASISEAELLPDFTPKLKTKLCAHAENLEPSPARSYLLGKVLKDEPEFNLGVFRKFGVEDFCRIIIDLQQSQKICALNFSNTPALDAAGLQRLLHNVPTLKTLYLMNTPNLPIHSVLSIIRDASICLDNIYHSDLFMFPMEDGRIPQRGWGPFPTGARTRSPVIQMLWINAFSRGLQLNASRNGGRVNWDSIIVNGGKTIVIEHGRFPLDDVLLPPVKIVNGLARIAEYGIRDSCSFDTAFDFAQVAVKSFAMASSEKNGSEFQVGPMPLELFSHERECHEHWPLLNLRESRPGDWTIVFLLEQYGGKPSEQPESPFHLRQRGKYALITPCESPESVEAESKFLVMDMSSFLAEVANDASEAQALSDYWENMQRENYSLAVFDKREVHDIVRVLFSGHVK